jgi:hypothetical protein
MNEEGVLEALHPGDRCGSGRNGMSEVAGELSRPVCPKAAVVFCLPAFVRRRQLCGSVNAAVVAGKLRREIAFLGKRAAARRSA